MRDLKRRIIWVKESMTRRGMILMQRVALLLLLSYLGKTLKSGRTQGADNANTERTSGYLRVQIIYRLFRNDSGDLTVCSFKCVEPLQH